MNRKRKFNEQGGRETAAPQRKLQQKMDRKDDCKDSISRELETIQYEIDGGIC